MEFIGYAIRIFGCAVLLIICGCILFWIIAEIYDASNPNRVQKRILKKAKLLLTSHLTPEQQKSVETYCYFLVKGSRTGMIYRINTNCVSMNIQCIDNGNKYCAIVPGVPCWDIYLAQKVIIEYDEDSFLKVAQRGMQGGRGRPGGGNFCT